MMLPFIRLNVFAILALIVVHSLGGQEQSDERSQPFRLLEGGRFVQGMDGGERALTQAFPLSTAGQAFGNAEAPAHVTWITKPFWMSATEVTVGQFKEFVRDSGYVTTAERGLTEMVGWDPTPDDKPLYQSHDFARDAKFSWRNPGFPQQDQHPVVGVSWADAKAYCRWLSEKEGERYRLPTEAEWEFACRAGTSTWFSFGDRAKGVVHQHANLGNVELEKHRRHAAERQWLLDWDNDPHDGFVFTAPVGSFTPNPWGIHDMHGNVWEWCEDLWLDTVYNDFERPARDRPNGVAVDPVNHDRPQTPINDFHTIRGGSWYNGDLVCRSSHRTFFDAEDAACYVGFRVVREAATDHPSPAKAAFETERAAIKSIRDAGGQIHSSNGIGIEVRLEGDTFDATVLEALAKLNDLEQLGLAWRNREASISQVAVDSIGRLRSLRTIAFQTGMNLHQRNLSRLSELPQLEVLRFPRDAPLNDHHLASLAGLTSLKEFQCFGTAGGLTDVGLANLKENRQLESLSAWECEASGDFLKSFHGCPLRNLACTAKPSSGAGRFETGSGGDGMTDSGAAHLAGFERLESLTLDGQTQLTLPTMRVISDLEDLRELRVRGCSGWVDADFAGLARLQGLRRVDLLNTQAGDIAASALEKIPRLESLSMGNEPPRGDHPLTDRGLANLSNAFSIQTMTLSSNAITDTGLKTLGRVNRLERLTITSDRVDGSGLGPLSKLPRLNDLSLRTPSLTDVAFDFLSQAKSISKLRLAHRGVRPPAALTDHGLQKMESATWLKELWLPRNGTGITEKKIDELKSKMPKTGVIPYTVTWE